MNILYFVYDLVGALYTIQLLPVQLCLNKQAKPNPHIIPNTILPIFDLKKFVFSSFIVYNILQHNYYYLIYYNIII